MCGCGVSGGGPGARCRGAGWPRRLGRGRYTHTHTTRALCARESRACVLGDVTRPPDRRGGASRDGCSMRGPGRSPGRKFLPLKRFVRPKSRTQQAYSTSFKSSRRDRHESGHTGVVGCETRGLRMAHGARGRAARVRARAPRRMRGGRAGAHLGQGWTGISPSSLHSGCTPGSSPARSSSAASKLPSERRPRALPPTGAESSGCLRNSDVVCAWT